MSKSYNPSSKNNNGWILCPSKTFPGKFYYFNVVNGEAAWSMNETEKCLTKRDNEIHKIADKYHCYPEPDTPPIESPEITTTNNIPTYQHLKPPNLTNISKSPYVQLPTFGQAAFPKYIPKIESCMPIVWMPIQCPTSVCVPEVKRSTTDQITQTSDPSILVHACGPCCKRFVNYDPPILNFDKQNKILNKDTYSRCVTSMLLKNKMTVPNLKMIDPATSILNKKEFQFQSNIPNLKMKESVFETSTPNKKEFQIQTGVPSFKIRKPVFNLESDSNISCVDNGNSTLGPRDRVDKCKSDYVKLLPETDLRHRLLSSAMRRNIGDKIDGHTDFNKNTVTKYESKKKVSFDLSNFLDEETCSTTYNENMPSTSAKQSPQVSQNVAATRTVWYIVVDTDVWLDEHEFIETIVLSDKNCKLLIPHAVRTDIEALSQGECRGRQRVFVARQLARRCATPPQHYVVDSAVSTAAGTLFTTDSILECCIDAVNDNYHVIIISNDPQLHIKAKSNNIPCYKIQDVKNTDIHTQAELDLKNIKITVSRDYDDIPNGETIDIISDDTLEMSVDSYRTQLLRENKVEGHKTDSKNVQNPILNYDSDSTTNEIRDLKNLNLKDKNQVLKIKRTVLNSNYNPNSNASNVRNEKEGIVKAVANSNVGDEFHFQKPISKWNCENSMLFQNPVPNLNCNESFLFQNAAKKYASTQSFDLKKQSTITDTFLNPNNIQIENTKTTKIPQNPNKIQVENNNIPKITEPKTLEKNKQPSFPVKINLNSTFKFHQTNLKIPPSFHVQTQNEIKNKVDHMPVLDQQIKNIDLDLKRFCVKSKIIDGKIQRRMEEWLCNYIHIMEDILNDVLQQSDHIVKKKLTPPWTLQEAILNIQIIYEDKAVVKYLVQKYLDTLANVTCTNGKLNKNMKSNDFMMIFGCGILLVQQFKNIHPDHRQLVDAEKNLNFLLETIECPIELHIEEFDLLPPAVCRSEMEEEVSRSNFVKDASYVLDYLKKHYKEWELYVLKEKPSVTAPPEMKVVRTFGKHLNMLKIDNNKSISLLKDNDPEKDGPKTIRSLNNKQPVERSAAKYMSLATNDTGINNNDGPKMIELSQTNQGVKRSLSLKKPLNKAIDTENNKAKPETVELIQCDKRITRSHTKNAVNISETENAGPKLVRTLANDHFKNETDFEKHIKDTLQKAESKLMSLESPIHGNTFLQSKDETAGPKVIRNLKSLEKYKNKFKQPLDLDLLDYSEINESCAETHRNDDIISISCDSYNATDITLNINQANNNRINDESKNDNLNNDKNTINNENTFIINKTNKNQGVSMNDYLDSSNDYRGNDVSRNDSCTNDSGFENDSTCAHSVVKIFFTELSDSFKIIHKFINDCAKEIKNNPSEDRKKVLHEKAAKSLEHLGVMIHQMNSIITRELNETTALRTLLLQAGIEASADKRISRYRQFVTKCVEQAGILSKALKIIVSLTGEMDSASIGVDSVGSSVRYFNIFDITS